MLAAFVCVIFRAEMSATRSRLRSSLSFRHDVLMETTKVFGKVVSETESKDWDVNVYLRLDGAGNILDHEELEFGAAPPPPSGDYWLVYSYPRGEQHQVRGHIERQTWQQAIFNAV
jgi:hypothetical protein